MKAIRTVINAWFEHRRHARTLTNRTRFVTAMNRLDRDTAKGQR